MINYHAPLGQILPLVTPLYLRHPNKIYLKSKLKVEDLIERKKITLSREQRNAVEIIKQISFLV